MSIRRFFLGGMAVFLLSASLARATPFDVNVTLDSESAAPLVRVLFRVPAGYHIYCDSIKLVADESASVTSRTLPDSLEMTDPVLEKIVKVYDHDVELVYSVNNWTNDTLGLTLSFRGCDEQECFLPEKKRVALQRRHASGADVSSNEPSAITVPLASTVEASGFRIKGTAVGYLNTKEFIEFLDKGKTTDSLRALFERSGIWMYLLAVLFGGLALNFTPCVLPMIPVNIAIIGAGAGGGSRKRGFTLGAAYGLGIAAVYGTLGLVFVRTSQRFGTLNSTPWFNLGIAALFLVMGLAMFGVFQVDLSRYLTRVGPQPGEQNRGRFMVALLMGGVSALLAGACVAPVVISVLLLATDLYSEGHHFAQFLPFAIGVGMAIPWPFAGAGLSFLPKPGRWMERVKIGFGIIIVVMALYYLKLGLGLLKGGEGSAHAGSTGEALHAGWYQSIEPAIQAARAEHKLVFVDFWASWCKNCVKMNKTTFQDPSVMSRLASTVNVAIQAEDIEDPAIKKLLDQYGVVGLPTYVLLEPLSENSGQNHGSK